jgi:serine/threonine protein kinase
VLTLALLTFFFARSALVFLRIEHRFEEKVYEHNRIDAIAMERLTKSPHVINIFGFCGNSVLTEYADGKRLGELADKSKKQPLARLRIARDIAQGLADVHGIDGDGNATFVHLDINPANVVSIGGTLKLNDFNIGILRRRNRASGAPCGFPAQYPNPQWRSPEEARGEPDLTEKVDVFSMGHIFFRLICGHEPWNKLEPGGKPGKAEVNDKVEKGILPHIPPDILESKDPEEAAIRDAMLRCYTFDPAERPSARSLADRLQEELGRLESERGGRASAPS